MNRSILVGTDDLDFYLTVNCLLRAEDFDTLLTSSPIEMTRNAAERKSFIIIVDWASRSFPVVETDKRLRRDDRTRGIPVTALVNSAADGEQAGHAQAGANDASGPSRSWATLLDRERTGYAAAPPETPAPSASLLQYADIELDLDAKWVRRNGRDIRLGAIEFQLLRYLLQHPERTFSRDELIGAAWRGNAWVWPRLVDVHVGNLRKVLKSESEGDLIRTVRSVGYALAGPA